MGKTNEGVETLRLVRDSRRNADADGISRFLLKGDATREHLILDAPSDLQAAAPSQPDHPFRLKVVHFNDLHGQVARVAKDGYTPVFSRMVTRIAQVRSECGADPYATVLVLSAGDDIIGTPFDLLVGGDPATYRAHPGYALYSSADVDAGALGNHEFDLGLELLGHAIRQDARFPILAANLKPNPQLSGLLNSAAVFQVKGVRIGVIGLVTPAAELRRRPGSEFEIVDPIPVVRRLLPLIRSLCDVVIILSHLGRRLGSSVAAMACAGDVELAQALPYGSVDLIVGAHTHDVLNAHGLDPENLVNGIPITQAGCNGRHLGEVDLVLENSVTLGRVAATVTAELPVDEAFERDNVRPLIEQLRPLLARGLGRVTDSPDLVPNGCCGGAACPESALHNFVTDGLIARLRARGQSVDLVMLDASAINLCLMPGQSIAYDDWLSVMPYADTIVFFSLSGRALRDFIQDNARRADAPGEAHIERGYQHFSADVRYRIPSNTAESGARAVDIVVQGVPLEQNLDTVYRIACISFFRALARNWERQTQADPPTLVFDPRQAGGVDTGLYVLDLMLEHIQQHGGVTQPGGARCDGRVTLAS